jgi:hypothetical protein
MGRCRRTPAATPPSAPSSWCRSVPQFGRGRREGDRLAD